MKKNPLLILFIFFSLSNCAQISISNNKEPFYIEYNLEFSKGKDSPQRFYTEVVLLVTDSISVNMDSRWLEVETLMAKGQDWLIPGRNSGLMTITLKNKVTEKMQILESYAYPKYMALEEDLMNLDDWNITGESKTQLGYATIKAVCKDRGRVWEAWFTPGIPISDGPYKFSGLPGLIVALKSTDGDFDFKLKAFSKMAEDQYIPTEYNYVVLPEEKFIDFIRNAIAININDQISKGSTFTLKNGNSADLMNIIKKEDANKVWIEYKFN